jgi:hypothetical protein
MAPVGLCGNLTSSSYLIVNEVTTVAAVYAVAPYMSSSQAVGSTNSDGANLVNAFNLATELVNTSTGTAPGTNVPAGEVVPVAQINTIANILATCINSPGGTSGDGSMCGTFFSLTTPAGATPPTDAVTALLNLAKNPTLHTSALYLLPLPTSPFQPQDKVQPANLSVSMQTGVSPVTVAISATSAVVPLGQANFTATVSNPAATGTVNFLSQNGIYIQALGTLSLAQGSATLTLPYYPTATLLVTAEYSGDANFTAASSAPFLQTIEPVETSTSLNASTSSGATTLTATVSGLTPTGNASPTGMVSFRDSPVSDAGVSFYPQLVGFGDSIMTSAVASTVANGFFALVAQDFPPVSTVRWAAIRLRISSTKYFYTHPSIP